MLMLTFTCHGSPRVPRCQGRLGRPRSRQFVQSGHSSPKPALESCRSTPDDTSEASVDSVNRDSQSGMPPPTERQRRQQRAPDSTDAIASALTRRFGLAGGLAWLGFLSAGVIGEQVKTRLEVAAEKSNTKEVKTRTIEKISGTTVTYTDEKVGGGARPTQGDLVVLNFKGYALVDGEKQLFVDTSDTGKPIVFIYKRRPFTAGNCLGVELALEDMRAGGKRHVFVPSEYGFGTEGVSLKPSRHVPEKNGFVGSNVDLEYDLELVRVSIPPS
jgi:FKBP-type peptidyl-prolyl cis-trans isomerase